MQINSAILHVRLRVVIEFASLFARGGGVRLDDFQRRDDFQTVPGYFVNVAFSNKGGMDEFLMEYGIYFWSVFPGCFPGDVVQVRRGSWLHPFCRCFCCRSHNFVSFQKETIGNSQSHRDVPGARPLHLHPPPRVDPDPRLAVPARPGLLTILRGSRLRFFLVAFNPCSNIVRALTGSEFPRDKMNFGDLSAAVKRTKKGMPL